MMTEPWDVNSIRRQFPGLARQHNDRPMVFLDGPGGSQVPQRVIDAVADCLAHHNANDGGAFATSREVGAIADSARRALADLLNADDPDAIVFGPNMTTLTMALSRSLARRWKPGDEIVVTRLDHDANVSPWVLAAKDVGVVVRFLEISPDCRLRMEMLGDVIGQRTKLVAVGVASNAVGTINPVHEIIEAAHRVRALVFLDAVHAVPHFQVDVTKLNADFVACSPYKFFGPHAGVLWGRRSQLDELAAYKVRPASNQLPSKWMTGTPSFEAMAGTSAAIDYLAELGGGGGRRSALTRAYQSIRQHESHLATRFLEGIDRLPDWKVWGFTKPEELAQRVSTFGLTNKKLSPRQAADRLADRGFCVWAGNFYAIELIEALGLAPQGLLRIGLLHYNTLDEVDQLLEALGEMTH